MTNHFSECRTMEEAQKLYRALIFQIHPDRRPPEETAQATRETQELNAEFADYCAHFANYSAKARQKAAHAEGKKSAADYHDIDELTGILREKILAALNLGLDVELCGLWVWVTGNTKPHKEELKALSFKWANEKKAWYFAGVPSFNRKTRTLDEIRAMLGSQKFGKTPNQTQPEKESLPA